MTNIKALASSLEPLQDFVDFRTGMAIVRVRLDPFTSNDPTQASRGSVSSSSKCCLECDMIKTSHNKLCAQSPALLKLCLTYVHVASQDLGFKHSHAGRPSSL